MATEDSQSEMDYFPCENMTDFDLGNMTSYKEMFHCSFLHVNVSTCLPLESRATRESIVTLCQAADRVWTVCFWVSTVTGLLGNSLALVTLRSLPMTPASLYVSLLAASDLAALLVRAGLQVLMDRALVTWYSPTANLVCLLYDYFASYSNWLLVLICFERFLTIRFPLRKRTCFTMGRAQAVALLTALALLAAYGLATWRLGYTEARIFTVRNLLYAVLPQALILTTILLIWAHLWRVHADREQTFHCSRPSQSSTPLAASETGLAQVIVNGHAQRSAGRKCKSPLQDIARLENSLTMMMLAAAVVFLVLTLPHCVTFFIYQNSIDSWASPRAHAQFYLLNKIFLAMTFFNLAVNFLLYFLSAKKFRSQLVSICRRGAWLRALCDHVIRSGQGAGTTPSTQQDSLPFDPIANGEYVSLRVLSGATSQGSIRLKTSGKVQFALDQSYYD
ncbi:hypothetical protein EGW08_004126 [Elysia chlorotica]|uniref:G-protein coupled receptors family 1 profile domain-containing protein n=1 Tax=Elysia chlorotica TaxID=188477 RepID=A0A3S1HXD8_ELYCH|nr:hypothetical protein EGW08_004126 [Elysia chlorotica]